jgi:hypothetical protein
VGRGDLDVVTGDADSDELVWAGIAEVLPDTRAWEGFDEGEPLFVHVLVVAANEGEASDLVAAHAMREHDAAFVGFALLEPLEARMARSVIDPAWAALADDLHHDIPLMCAGVFDDSEFVRARAREPNAALWGGALVVAEDGEEELMGAIAVAARREEFEAVAGDYIERMGVELVRWESRDVLVEAHVGEGVVGFFGDSTVYTSTTWPRGKGGDIWRGVAQIDRQERASPEGAEGAFVPVLAAAESESEFTRLVSHWYKRWGETVVDFLDVEILAERSRLPDFAEWVTQHFGFFHGVHHGYAEVADD